MPYPAVSRRPWYVPNSVPYRRGETTEHSWTPRRPFTVPELLGPRQVTARNRGRHAPACPKPITAPRLPPVLTASTVIAVSALVITAALYGHVDREAGTFGPTQGQRQEAGAQPRFRTPDKSPRWSGTIDVTSARVPARRATAVERATAPPRNPASSTAERSGISRRSRQGDHASDRMRATRPVDQVGSALGAVPARLDGMLDQVGAGLPTSNRLVPGRRAARGGPLGGVASPVLGGR
jgi:hypothetical protein